MKLIKVAAVVINQTPLDWSGNLERILGAIEEARDRGVSVLCFPELCIPGYGSEDAFYALETVERSWQMLDEILPHTRGMIVSLGVPTLYKNGLFNTAALLVDGTLHGLAAKKFLAGDGIYYEPRWFRPWPLGVQACIPHRGEEIPIGDVLFEVDGVKIGFEICEDAWVSGRPGVALARHGVDVILNPSGSHFAFEKFGVRQRFVLEGSRAFNVTYVYSNLLGNESGRAIFDGGAMIASSGEMKAIGERFSYQPWQITEAIVDVAATRMRRSGTGSYVPSFEQSPSGEVCIATSFAFPVIEPRAPRVKLKSWEQSEHVAEEEFSRAVALALFDYLRKSWSKGYVVSLSGGADSAAVSVLAALSVEFAERSIGLEGLKQKLSYIPAIQHCESAKEMVPHLLTCAYQATRHSGEVTRQAASEVASALGATYHELDVDELVEGYRSIIEQAIGRELSWDQDDITLQNIQARVRSPSIWMFANLNDALLLATSNRSEAAVGYATMDGDTSGGVSPIAGIDKEFLRRWLNWMERIGPEGLGPIEALGFINAQQPTAELRPEGENQTDEGDLMPYALLDAIEDVAIGDKKAPVDVYRIMRRRFPEYEPKQLHIWVERFFILWSRNQWKRERYAPSFHLDDKNLDPKTWCRWPILSGAFRDELDELRAYVAARV